MIPKLIPYVGDFIQYLYCKANALNYKDLSGRPYIPSWRIEQNMWYESIKNEFMDSLPPDD